MTTNATVEARHRDEAAKAAGYRNWEHADNLLLPSSDTRASIFAHAQTLANLEAANNRLAEIDRIARDEAKSWASRLVSIENLASGHTPSPCPGCAAKDEAMEAFQREVSDAIVEFGKSSRFDVARTAESYHSHLTRFIIPPADPVAEALKAAVQDAWDGPCSTEESTVAAVTRNLMANLAKHGLELSRLGGAK